MDKPILIPPLGPVRYTVHPGTKGTSMHHEKDDDSTVTIPRIPIPEYVPPTEEVLKRRQELAGKIERLREEIGPIGIRADELKHLSRTETED
jgi:hypothetical protein